MDPKSTRPSRRTRCRRRAPAPWPSGDTNGGSVPLAAHLTNRPRPEGLPAAMRRRFLAIHGVFILALQGACTVARTGPAVRATDSVQVAAIVPDLMRFLNAGAFDSLRALLTDDFEILE